MSLPKWGGRRAQAWTAAVLARYGRACVLRLPGCTHVATTGDHIKPRALFPALQYDVTNGRPSCLPCNQLRGIGLNDPPSVVDERGFFETPDRSGKDCYQSPPRSPRKTGEPGGLVRFESDGGRS